VFERKLKAGDFKSSAAIGRWEDTLVHLLDRTEGREGRKVLGLGEVWVHMLEKPIQQ
jgi:hypothetical protein